MKANAVDNYYKEKLEKIEIVPSNQVWNNIEYQLEEKKRPLLFWLPIAASFLLVLSIGSYFLFNTNAVQPLYKYTPTPIEVTPKSINITNGSIPRGSKSVPIMAQESSLDVAQEHTAISGNKFAFADYVGDESEFAENTIWPIDRIKMFNSASTRSKTIVIADASSFKKRNPSKHRYSDELKDYSVAQWDNLKHGSAVQAPPKMKIDWQGITPKFLQPKE